MVESRNTVSIVLRLRISAWGLEIPTVDHTLIPNSSETRPHVALYEATRQVRIKCSVEKILGLDGVHHPLHSFL
jgi:hypothetical protein